jgi:hypothetical protein
MFKQLPTDLQNIVFSFAYDANKDEVDDALGYLLFMKELRLHPATVRDGVFDFTHCNRWLYSRESRDHLGFFAPWSAERVDSPYRSFFVWWSKRDLYDCTKMGWIINDMDFRSTRHLFRDFPIQPCRNYKLRVKTYIERDPEQAAVFLSPIFQALNNQHLNLHTSSLGRYVASEHCVGYPEWKLFSVIMV